MSHKPTLIIVEDHQSVLNDLQESFRSFNVVGSAMTGDEFEALMSSGINFDLAVLDILVPLSENNPDQAYSLIDALPQIRALNPNAKLLFHSQTTPYGYLDRLLQNGVGGFIHKGDRYQRGDLDMAALQVLKGRMHFSPKIAPLLATRKHDSLRNEHIDLLQYFFENPSNTNGDAAAHFYVSVSTIKHRLKEIHNSLGTQSRTDALLVAIKRNLISNISL